MLPLPSSVEEGHINGQKSVTVQEWRGRPLGRPEEFERYFDRRL